MSCNGTERRLSDCPASEVGVHNCGHWEDAGAICSNDFLLRIVNSQQVLKSGENVSEGRLEVSLSLSSLLSLIRCLGVPRGEVGYSV